MDHQTVNSYNKFGQSYDQDTSDFWEIYPRVILDEFIESVGKGNILDIGSGSGRDAEIFRKAGLNVTCLDASKTMIHMTKAKGFKSVKADFMVLPFNNSSFDGVWAYTSLLHIPKKDLSKALKEIGRVLKLSGFLGLGMIEGNTVEYRVTSKVNSPRLFAYYIEPELRKAIESCRFDVIRFEKFKPNKRNYLNFIVKKV